MKSPLIVDAHEDLAWNILTFGRDYSRSVTESRQSETGTPTAQHSEPTLLGWPDYQQGRVGLVFGTLFAAPERRRLGEWETQVYTDLNHAHRLYRTQLAAYYSLIDQHPDKFRLVETTHHLDEVLADWESPAETHTVGLVMLMEGAEGVRSPGELEEWWKKGVRIIGPAWAGTRFCGGTREPGPLTKDGFQLLNSMAECHFTLDLSHMDELSARQLLDAYPEPIIASHANAAAEIQNYTGNRQLSDAVIRGLLEHNGVIGVIPFLRFLKYGWTPTDGRMGLGLELLAVHIDHICQLAGDAAHVGIGSDFDGGFGLLSVPEELDTIADLQKLVPILAARGYTSRDVNAILGDNWIRHLKENLPNE